MRKPTIKHEYLKKYIDEFFRSEEEVPGEIIDNIVKELIHSCLITPSTKDGDYVNASVAKSFIGEFAVAFTDMDEFRRAFPDFEVEAHEFPFEFYCKLVQERDLNGLIINMEGEMFILPSDVMDMYDELPPSIYPTDNAYSTAELKKIRDSIDNSDLEKFIENPKSIGRYEGLIDKISNSTILTLMVSRNDLSHLSKDGIIEMKPDDPLGFLYTEKLGGEYATVYTSEDKIKLINTKYYRYSQIVNFPQLVNFILNEDLDGIIINPNGENIVLTRDVLLDYYKLIEEACYDERLNASIFCMFEMEDEK